MKVPNLDALGHQVIAYDVAIKTITIVQVLAHADPVVGSALAQALRDNSEKLPKSFRGVKALIDEYAALTESQVAKAKH